MDRNRIDREENEGGPNSIATSVPTAKKRGTGLKIVPRNHEDLGDQDPRPPS